MTGVKLQHVFLISVLGVGKLPVCYFTALLKDLEGGSRGLCHLFEGTEGTTRISAMVAGVPAEIRTENFPSRSLQR
jgi:hypothetical protein